MVVGIPDTYPSCWHLVLECFLVTDQLRGLLSFIQSQHQSASNIFRIGKSCAAATVRWLHHKRTYTDIFLYMSFGLCIVNLHWRRGLMMLCYSFCTSPWIVLQWLSMRNCVFFLKFSQSFLYKPQVKKILSLTSIIKPFADQSEVSTLPAWCTINKTKLTDIGLCIVNFLWCTECIPVQVKGKTATLIEV